MLQFLTEPPSRNVRGVYTTNLLSKHWCNALIDQMKASQQIPAEVNDQGAAATKPEYRSARLCKVDNAVDASVAHKIQAVMKLARCEPTQYLLYSGATQDHFGEHSDNSQLENGTWVTVFSERKYTAVILLNNDFEGGEFVLEGHRIPLGVGDLIIFPSDEQFKHAVYPVTQGTRCSVVTWLGDKDYD